VGCAKVANLRLWELSKLCLFLYGRYSKPTDRKPPTLRHSAMFRQILSTLRRSTIFKRIPFERDAGFHDAALTLGFSEDTAHKIDNVASGMFGDLRWTNSCEGDNYFIKNLLNMQALSVNLEEIPMIGAVTEAWRDHDFLYRVLLNSAPGEYGFVKALNLATMACIEPSVPCALVASVRNEGPFLIEWLAYNRALGIKDIYIYTNDNTDGSSELLKRLAEHGVIKLILNETSLTVNPQVKAYEHSLLLLPELRKFEWVLYLDADEFFIPAAKYDFRIGPLISNVKERFTTSLPACIC
jgi:hypothetical protein